MKQLITLLIAATFAGCSCDCGTIIRRGVSMSNTQSDPMFLIENDCGTEWVPCTEEQYFTLMIGEEFCP